MFPDVPNSNGEADATEIAHQKITLITGNQRRVFFLLSIDVDDIVMYHS